MANIQIPNLPAAIALNGSEQIEAVQAGTSVRINVNQIVQYVINYVFGLSAAPITITSDYTIQEGDVWIIANGPSLITLTLPSPSENIGRVLTVKSITANGVVSSSINVTPIGTAIPTDEILPLDSGVYAKMVSDGYNWIIMSTNSGVQGALLWS